jgi:hypothetical protein
MGGYLEGMNRDIYTYHIDSYIENMNEYETSKAKPPNLKDGTIVARISSCFL